MSFIGVFSAVADKIEPLKGVWEWLLDKLQFIPNYAWWIIVFTVMLKVMLSPLDFYQRYKMKKNQRISEKLKPEMAKLEKQYAGNKPGLQKAQMALQRSAGFSYFSACIPMIVTLVIFFSFYAGMGNVSKYQEFKQYVERYDVYASRYLELTNQSFIAGVDTPRDDYDSDEFDALIEDWNEKDNLGSKWDAAYAAFEDAGKSYKALSTAFKNGTDEFKYLSAVFKDRNDAMIIEDIRDNPGKYDQQNIQSNINRINGKMFALTVPMRPDSLNEIANGFSGFDQLLRYYEKYLGYDADEKNLAELSNVAHHYAAREVYVYYQEHNSGFLWIKSIWIADVPWANGVLSYKDFVSSNHVQKYMNEKNAGKLPSNVHAGLKTETNYNRIMAEIFSDKDIVKTNGLLLLAVLALGFSLLSQVVSTRQQKKSGQQAAAGGTMKMMMFIMPVMIAIFAITSTAAFALYMITNSAMTLIINLINTAILTLVFGREAKQSLNETGVQRYGRADPNDRLKAKTVVKAKPEKSAAKKAAPEKTDAPEKTPKAAPIAKAEKFKKPEKAEKTDKPAKEPEPVKAPEPETAPEPEAASEKQPRDESISTMPKQPDLPEQPQMPEQPKVHEQPKTSDGEKTDGDVEVTIEPWIPPWRRK